ncbi:hypothetical protein FBZ85_12930 [Azospirillum brasilense]|nr:hypothetical protein FBZ85_12930 [Azospirillum brasilense]
MADRDLELGLDALTKVGSAHVSVDTASGAAAAP